MPQTLESANINNLIRLWQSMGASAWPDKRWRQSDSWPFRLFPVDVDQYDPEGWHPEHVRHADRVILPVFEPWYRSEAFQQRLQQTGWQVAFRQIAMVAPLKHADPSFRLADKPMEILEPSTKGDCRDWTAACSEAFRYWVDTVVIERLQRDPAVTLLMGRLDDKVIATALIYQTGGILGVHQVGVVPAFQAQGYGQQMMKAVMQRCLILPEARYVTLQAAEAAVPLYEKLKFEKQFLIHCYQPIPDA
ncbi:Uncharacterised protein [BD1-7 clade bacterium]|uniref:N-acetyltransferase domain-containing protein n=1 Tax=BD1-7 clade bacterium TaxID=2029982 RepID=A0A5S9N1K5_9GAMM|nr:Uncharacterised protein [BD1-7 clade bacterium]CAA0083558.1 Uncharacterised protein [BD1-7 clade bacterium]